MSGNVSDPDVIRQREAPEARPQDNGTAGPQDQDSGTKPGCKDNPVDPVQVTLTVGLEPGFKRLLEAKAKKQGITVSELLGNILRADISSAEKLSPE